MRYLEYSTLARQVQGPQGFVEVPSHVIYLHPEKVLSVEPAFGPSRALAGSLVVVGTLINCGSGLAYVVQSQISDVLEDLEGMTRVAEKIN